MGLEEERADQNFLWSSESISWLLQHSSGLVLMVGSSRVTRTEKLWVSLVGAITTFPYIISPARLGLKPLGSGFPWLVVSESTLACCHPIYCEQICKDCVYI